LGHSLDDAAAGIRSPGSDLRHTSAILIFFALTALTGFASAQMAHKGEHDAEEGTSFRSQMMQAMQEMDAGMMAAKATGDADRDFAAMMIPHHQGAVDMAKLELLYGRDPVLRRLAQGIMVEQQQEIEVMRRRLQALSGLKP
jgi:uncharacterized protein (DUF305 family)